MCGITGFLGLGGDDGAVHVQRMVAALAHRGPDDAGIWVDPAADVALGHRRLAILDLSPAGHQPMICASGRYVVVFNGEIYNHRSLRSLLQAAGLAPDWRGHSDTETLLAAIEAWGVESALQRLIGMFAFALWDRRDRRLFLARDRLGEKPLYFGWSNRTFVFGSELKALRAFPGFSAEVDRGSLALFLRYGYVPDPYCIYSGIRKLSAGTYLSISSRDLATLPAPVAYWSACTVAEAGARESLTCTAPEAIEQLHELLRAAIAGQMSSDVPLGALLSGGIDSSTIVALMQEQSPHRVRTFTIGFHEQGYDEAQYASRVARQLGTEHTEMYVTPTEAMAVIPRLPALYDEPFADVSQIPTFLVAQIARRQVTVALTGDGGDELFGGYGRYAWGQRIWPRMRRCPAVVRRAAAAMMRGVAPQKWDALYHCFAQRLPNRWRNYRPGSRLHRCADMLVTGSLEEMYRELISQWNRPQSVVLDAHEPVTENMNHARRSTALNPFEYLMYLDLVAYLPGDLLVKVDRAAMGVSLETRVPLLDHRVVEFAARVPLAWKVRGGQTKWLLRQVLYRYLRPEIVDRPKMGFGVPIGDWLRGPLREWAATLLSRELLEQQGFFDPTPIGEKWQAHLSAVQDSSLPLWNVLMFQAWLEAQSTALPPAAHDGVGSAEKLAVVG